MPESKLCAALQQIIAAPPYGGSQVQFAAHVGIGAPIVSRILLGRRPATPDVVRAICSTLPKDESATVLSAYFADLAAAILAEGPPSTAKVSVKIRRYRS